MVVSTVSQEELFSGEISKIALPLGGVRLVKSRCNNLRRVCKNMTSICKSDKLTSIGNSNKGYLGVHNP